MKKVASMLLVFCLFSIGHAFAGYGKAIIPHMSANTATDSINLYWISNITEHDIKVTITFYDQDGNALTSGVSYTNFINSNADIAAGKTGLSTVDTSTWKYGYGVIEWENKGSDEDVVALVAHGFFDEKDGSSNPQGFYAISINAGMPF
ncbi:hypothetical protein SCOR_18840 [Sulfidibacter corallicola]|uniref:Uncharacterized protein n=1 Tax=Sulfidibacter corallicola TaxID=2818388 RepID=A0A8A4TU52_SULCO|nr:hypothetical protein [Sulfidibacter corallicola]QTD53496.1 hypothetical protein J3U87_13660 [Sulfidibacter corallicola]